MKKMLFTLIILSMTSLSLSTLSFAQRPDSLEAQAKQLKSKDEAEAKAAMEALAEKGAEALGHVKPLLEHPNKNVRMRAAKTIGLIALRARKNLEEAKKKAQAATAALKECGAAFQGLAAGLKDSNAEARAEAAVALGLVARGKEKEVAAEHLKKALGDKNNKVRTGAAMGLGFLGKAAGVAVSELRKTLKDKNSKCRAASAAALGEIGPGARGAIADLEAAESDKNGTVRRAATSALKKIRG